MQPQDEQRLQPQRLQDADELLVFVLPFVPVLVPATLLWLQRQLHVQPVPEVLLSEVPPTDPLDELEQQGLQQEFCTKLGKIMLPKQPELQELHIFWPSIQKKKDVTERQAP